MSEDQKTAANVLMGGVNMGVVEPNARPIPENLVVRRGKPDWASKGTDELQRQRDEFQGMLLGCARSGDNVSAERLQAACREIETILKARGAELLAKVEREAAAKLVEAEERGYKRALAERKQTTEQAKPSKG